MWTGKLRSFESRVQSYQDCTVATITEQKSIDICDVFRQVVACGRCAPSSDSFCSSVSIHRAKMTDLRQCSRVFITDFIALYESLPCLWRIKSKEYSDRDKKGEESLGSSRNSRNNLI